MNAINLIDRFVAVLNSTGLAPLPQSEVPPDLRTAVAGVDEARWQFKSAEATPWIAEFEAKLPVPLPPSYRELVSRYRFAQFEIDPILFFANTGTQVYHELADAVFMDKRESKYLLDSGYIQFGREAGDGYDPVCFDTTRMDLDGEYPIVRIDHEEILTAGTVAVRQTLAASFAEFVELYLARCSARV